MNQDWIFNAQNLGCLTVNIIAPRMQGKSHLAQKIVKSAEVPRWIICSSRADDLVKIQAGPQDILVLDDEEGRQKIRQVITEHSKTIPAGEGLAPPEMRLGLLWDADTSASVNKDLAFAIFIEDSIVHHHRFLFSIFTGQSRMYVPALHAPRSLSLTRRCTHVFCQSVVDSEVHDYLRAHPELWHAWVTNEKETRLFIFGWD